MGELKKEELAKKEAAQKEAEAAEAEKNGKNVTEQKAVERIIKIAPLDQLLICNAKKFVTVGQTESEVSIWQQHWKRSMR